MLKIAFVGPQCAGKTSCGEIIETASSCNNRGFFTSVHKFAFPLYKINDVLGVKKNRAFMQDLSSVIKKHYGREIFIELFDERMNKNLSFLTYCYLNDDCRFDLEAKYLKDNGWTLVYVNANRGIRRARAEAQGLEFIENHETETEATNLGDWCEFEVKNELSLDYLHDEVISLLRVLEHEAQSK